MLLQGLGKFIRKHFNFVKFIQFMQENASESQGGCLSQALPSFLHWTYAPSIFSLLTEYRFRDKKGPGWGGVNSNIRVLFRAPVFNCALLLI